MVKYFLPLASDESVAGVGLRRFDIESIVAGKAPYETWKPATAVPVVGTENCGFPRDGVRESFTGSHAHSDGWRLKSVNHSQAVRSNGAASSSTRARVHARLKMRLPLTPHLGRPVLLQQILCRPRLLGWTFDPDSVITVTETRVVSNHHRQTRNTRGDEKAGNSRQSANQYHHFKPENGVRNPGRNWLPSHNQRPIVRNPDRDPVPEGAAEQSADQREPAHRTWRRCDSLLQFVPRCRSENADLAEVLFLQCLDRVDCGVEVVERRQYAAHQANSPGVSASNSK